MSDPGVRFAFTGGYPSRGASGVRVSKARNQGMSPLSGSDARMPEDLRGCFGLRAQAGRFVRLFRATRATRKIRGGCFQIRAKLRRFGRMLRDTRGSRTIRADGSGYARNSE